MLTPDERHVNTQTFLYENALAARAILDEGAHLGPEKDRNLARYLDALKALGEHSGLDLDTLNRALRRASRARRPTAAPEGHRVRSDAIYVHDQLVDLEMPEDYYDDKPVRSSASRGPLPCDPAELAWR